MYEVHAGAVINIASGWESYFRWCFVSLWRQYLWEHEEMCEEVLHYQILLAVL